MEPLTLTGLVLNAMPIGEYDKRISLLTLERGKISVFLRGAKRPNSALLAAGNPFTFGEFSIHEGRNSYSASKVHIRQHFDTLTKDLTKVWYGSYFLEVAEYYARENADEKERLTLLYRALSALESDKFTPDFIRLLYDMKTFVLSGEFPNVFTCLRCQKETSLTHFSLELRGCVCSDCAKEEVDLSIKTSTLYTLQFIFSTPAKDLFTFRVTDVVEKELSELMKMYRRRYFPHVFKSESFLNL